MKVGITGHRPYFLYGEFDPKTVSKHMAKIEDALAVVMERHLGWKACFEENTDEIEGLTGMAVGTDQWFAYACNKLKIPFTAYIPCKNHSDAWPPHARMDYRNLLRSAKKVIYTSDDVFWMGCMQKRNEWLVRDCDILIAYYDGRKKGGTADAVRRAKKMGKEVVIITPYNGEDD